MSLKIVPRAGALLALATVPALAQPATPTKAEIMPRAEIDRDI
jgi:hypothetical protein